jgi:hypothetical protein
MSLKGNKVDEFFGADEDALDDSTNDHIDGHSPNDFLHSGLQRAETTAEQERFRNIGYHEAYNESKEERLQEGFEAGYSDNYDLSIRIGECIGKVVMESKLLELRKLSTSGREEIAGSSKSLRASKVARTARTFLANKDNHKSLADLEQQITAIVNTE